MVAAKLADCGIESYYPFVLAKSRRLYRPEIEKKFFPGYVFAKFDLEESAPVIRIAQVVRILGFADRPAPVPEVEIENVKIMVATPELCSPCSFLAAGDAVLICRGPLRGIEGFVLYEKPGRARVVVSVAMLGRSLSTEVDVDCIEVRKPASQQLLAPSVRVAA